MSTEEGGAFNGTRAKEPWWSWWPLIFLAVSVVAAVAWAVSRLL